MIQVINRALNILELVSKEKDREYSLSEIASSLNLNASTCANIIKTLVNRGYLEQQGRKQGYKLGAQSFYLTGNYSNKKELIRASIEPLKILREKLNESCILAIAKENVRVTLLKEVSSHELQVVTNDEEKNLYQTATGRIILACFEDDVRAHFIQKYGLPNELWSEIRDEKDLIYELDKIKQKQLAIHSDGEYIVGVGVPVYKNEQVIAAIGVYLPEVRFNFRVQEMIFSELSKTAKQISKIMSEIHTK